MWVISVDIILEIKLTTISLLHVNITAVTSAYVGSLWKTLCYIHESMKVKKANNILLLWKYKFPKEVSGFPQELQTILWLPFAYYLFFLAKLSSLAKLLLIRKQVTKILLKRWVSDTGCKYIIDILSIVLLSLTCKKVGKTVFVFWLGSGGCHTGSSSSSPLALWPGRGHLASLSFNILSVKWAGYWYLPQRLAVRINWNNRYKGRLLSQPPFR